MIKDSTTTKITIDQSRASDAVSEAWFIRIGEIDPSFGCPWQNSVDPKFVISIDQECTDENDPNKFPTTLPPPDSPNIETLTDGNHYGTTRIDEWYVPYKRYKLTKIRVW